MFFFSLCGIAFCCIYCCVLTNDLKEMLSLSQSEDSFMKLVCMVGAAGATSTIAMLIALGTGGTISLNAAGTVKDAILTYIGFAYFQDKPTMTLCAGMVINAIGTANLLRFRFKQNFQAKQSDLSEVKNLLDQK